MSNNTVHSETNPAVIYRSEVRATPAGGGIKLVSLPCEAAPVPMGMHGEIADHYKLPEGSYTPRAATLDYLGRRHCRLPVRHASPGAPGARD